MKILLIAPTHPDLPAVDSEIAAITRFHDVEQVLGNVRESDIEEAVERGPYDVIWWATHGNERGVKLGRSTLATAAVGQYVVASGASLCVLNTCSSETIARVIVSGGTADMIYGAIDMKDTDAFRFGSLLANELAKDPSDYHEAFVKAAPRGGEYFYLNAKSTPQRGQLSIEERVRDMEQILYGNNFSGEPGYLALQRRYLLLSQLNTGLTVAVLMTLVMLLFRG